MAMTKPGSLVSSIGARMPIHPTMQSSRSSLGHGPQALLSLATAVVLLIHAGGAYALVPRAAKQHTPQSVPQLVSLRGGATPAPRAGASAGSTPKSEFEFAGVKLNSLASALRVELFANGLEYMLWSYSAAFTVFSLHTYCTNCSDSRIKSAIPAMFVLMLLWRLSERTMQAFKNDPIAAKGRPRIGLELWHYTVVSLNVVSIVFVLADLMWCLLRQHSWPVKLA
jgi:hypothetical protein